uniref:Uncharacterized protein n=1 Tax=Ciona savignyi TaxID=51511 RepID=H2YGG1_CIOSA
MLARYHPNATVRSPAYLNNVFGWNVNNAETLASLQGSEIGSTSTLTPLSQASISNAEFLSLQSAHKDVFGSSLPTTLTQTHDTGTQVQGGSTSPMSTVSSLPDEWRAVVTPSLVASVCRFLTNLVSISPRDTIAALMQRNLLCSFNSLLDADHIESLFTKISSLNEDGNDAEQSARKSI